MAGNSISLLRDAGPPTKMVFTFPSRRLSITEELLSPCMMFPMAGGRRPDSVSFHVVDIEDTLNLMRLLSTTMNVVAYMPVRVARVHWK